ncbi:chromatin-remodeling ATPase INO80-like isoform X2 [Papaver somniferum]|uniref:chromatin-remodeling ATPase INO80-like isoform X2 n=1 Tax=Papaver somniferum TaxID=3469 RepID=UPI000E705D5C|nr:chromatin-remodeling ATPase INO80-like isoform X2 [Papaver somniferum]
MDFHTLARRELQALCKKNKIPANMTNVTMADALSALTMVDGVEDIGKTMPETPLTSRTARKPIKAQSDVVEPKTSMGFARPSRESMKEVPIDDHEYSTRRSTRLQQKSEIKVSESLQKVGGRNGAIKMEMLSKEEYEEEMKSISEIADDVQQKNGGNVKAVKEEPDAISEDSVTTVLVGGDSTSEVTSAPKVSATPDVSFPLVKTENLVDANVDEGKSSHTSEVDLYDLKVTDNFDFETMKDSMKEVMSNLEAEGCDLDTQQEDHIIESEYVDVAAILDTEVNWTSDDEASDENEEESDNEESDAVEEEDDSDVEEEISDAGEENGDASDVDEDIVNQTPSKTTSLGNQDQGTPLRSSTKKKAITTPKSLIKVLDDNKVGLRSNSKVVSEVATEEKENKGDNTAQRKLKSTSVRQLKKMIKQLTLVDNKDTSVKVEKRPALQQLSGNCSVDEKEE